MAAGRGVHAHGTVVPFAGGDDPAPTDFLPLDNPEDNALRPMLSAAGRRVHPGALAGAIAVHIAVTVSLLWDIPDPGAKAAGQGGIVMAFEIAGAAAGAQVETPGQDQVSDTEPADPPEVPKAEEVVEADVPKKEATPVKEQTAEAVPEPVPVAAPEIPEKLPIPDVAEPEIVPPPEPKPVVEAAEALPKVVPAESPEEFAALRPSRRPDPPVPEPPVKEPERAVEEPVPPAENDQVTERSATAAVAGAGGLAERSEAEGKGSGQSKAGGGFVGASTDYFAILRAWLEQHKEYPRRARIRREQGTVLLRMTFVPGGDLLAYDVQRSSGHPDLDRAAESMIRRSQPFPPAPSGTKGTLEVVVPVSFLLQ